MVDGHMFELVDRENLHGVRIKQKKGKIKDTQVDQVRRQLQQLLPDDDTRNALAFINVMTNPQVYDKYHCSTSPGE